MTKPEVGLALGSGSARGWAHIGVLGGLARRGIVPDVVAGASVGSLVGAAFASGQLETLEQWVRGLSRVEVLRLLDTSLRRGGMMSGDRLMRAIRERIEDHDIEDLAVPFAAVATQLDTGLELWLREGPMLRAVRASSGLPGLFTPVWHEGRWLVDGGVVNPVPVSVCRALGADYVIGVNLNRHLRTYPRIRRRRTPPPEELAPSVPEAESKSEPWPNASQWPAIVSGLIDSLKPDEPTEPGIFEVIGTSISIMQDRIMRSRMVGDPPDLVLDPDLGSFELLDFHRADEAIAAGHAAVDAMAEQVEEIAAAVG